LKINHIKYFQIFKIFLKIYLLIKLDLYYLLIIK
jgi:hypothetical protein